MVRQEKTTISTQMHITNMDLSSAPNNRVQIWTLLYTLKAKINSIYVKNMYNVKVNSQRQKDVQIFHTLLLLYLGML